MTQEKVVSRCAVFHSFNLFLQTEITCSHSVYFSRVSFAFQDHCESVAILKIKESMQEEARRFETTDGTTDPQGEFFMQ